MTRWLTSLATFAIVTSALLFGLGCGAGSRPAPWQPEPWSSLERLPRSGNLVAFGESVASPASRAEAVRYLDGVVRGRLPGVRFEVYRHPVALPPGMLGVGPGGAVTSGPVTSYRIHPAGPVVLSWWGRERPGVPILAGWTVGDAPWEVEHLVAGTDDNGRPWNP